MKYEFEVFHLGSRLSCLSPIKPVNRGATVFTIDSTLYNTFAIQNSEKLEIGFVRKRVIGSAVSILDFDANQLSRGSVGYFRM